MIGSLSGGIVTSVKQNFEHKCVCLLDWACRRLKTEKIVDGDWGEENISANIYTYIKCSQQAIDDNIFVESEHPFFSQDILDNKKKANSAPCIDIVFQHNWGGHAYYYHVEAKNLIHSDYIKTGRKRKTKASKVQRRYIETGIDHFVSSYYPKGCLLGYVLNGTISDITNGINALLSRDGRDSERLQYVSGVEPWVNYQSNHTGMAAPIEHFLFNFN